MKVPYDSGLVESFYRKKAQLKDLRGVERVIDSRNIEDTKEFLCVFPFEREAWLDVPDGHPILVDFFKHVEEEKQKGESGVFISEEWKRGVSKIGVMKMVLLIQTGIDSLLLCFLCQF